MKVITISLLCMLVCSHAQGVQKKLVKLFDDALVLLEQVQQQERIYIPRVYNKELAHLLKGLSTQELIDMLWMAEKQDNVFVINGLASLLVNHLSLNGVTSFDYLQKKVPARAYGFIKKFARHKDKKETTHTCGTDLSVADYVNLYGVPLVYLGNVGILRFDDKELTSLYGIQDLSYNDVAIATFAYNCIVGNTLDPQFPNDPFQGLPNLIWLFLNENNIESLPSSFLDAISGLGILDLNENDLTGLPEAFFSSHDELGVVSFSTNMITTVSAGDLQGIPNVTSLSLDNNSLIEVPADLFQYNPFITEIIMNNNLLTVWPSSLLNDLEFLQYLDLSYNLLDSFEPESIVDGAQIVLTGNQLTTSQEDFLIAQFPEVTFEF